MSRAGGATGLPAPQGTPPGTLTPAAPGRAAWLALLVALVLGGAGLRLLHLSEVDGRSPDEQVYLDFARRVADGGLAAFPALFAEYEGDVERWSYPVPSRVTYVLAVAGVVRATGLRDERAGVAVSVAASCLALALLALVGWRLFGPGVACLAVLLLACSFTELGMARRAWQDATFGCIGLALLWSTLELARRPERPGWYPAFLGLGALALLTKQTGLVAFGLCGAWLELLLLRERRWRAALALAAGGLASLALAVLALGWLAGGVGPALSATAHSMRPVGLGLEYVLEVSTGPWHRLLGVLWLIDPVTVLATGAGAAAALAPGPLGLATAGLREPRAAAGAAVLGLGFVAFTSLVPGLQNVRYLAPADGALALLAAVGLWWPAALARRVLSPRAARLAVALAVALPVAGCLHAYRAYLVAVVIGNLPDLPALWLIEHLARPS